MGSANSFLSVGQMFTHFRVVGSLNGVVPLWLHTATHLFPDDTSEYKVLLLASVLSHVCTQRFSPGSANHTPVHPV